MNAARIKAVVLGSSPTGLYAVRELARAGCTVAVADVAHGCALHSRYVQSASQHFVGEVDAIERWLESIGSDGNERALLVPTSDIFIEYLLRHADALTSRFVFPAAYHGLAASLLDKADFHALCQTHGMATPGVWQAPNRAALAALAPAVPFPCILKPALIHHAREYLRGRKVLLARDRPEFEAHLADMPDDLGGWLVQEIIPGPESNITLFAGYVDQTGTPRQVFTARKVRQYPPGFGSASLVSSEPCVETEQLTLDFLSRIGFRGICGAEYKRDPRDGQLKIIEINPRPTLWFQITHEAGKRVVEAALRDLCGGAMPTDKPQDPSVRWRYALKDAASARFYRHKGESFLFPQPDVASAARLPRRSWPVFAVDDPWPALFEPLGYLRKVWIRR